MFEHGAGWWYTSWLWLTFGTKSSPFNTNPNTKHLLRNKEKKRERIMVFRVFKHSWESCFCFLFSFPSAVCTAFTKSLWSETTTNIWSKKSKFCTIKWHFWLNLELSSGRSKPDKWSRNKPLKNWRNHRTSQTSRYCWGRTTTRKRPHETFEILQSLKSFRSEKPWRELCNLNQTGMRFHSYPDTKILIPVLTYGPNNQLRSLVGKIGSATGGVSYWKIMSQSTSG